MDAYAAARAHLAARYGNRIPPGAWAGLLDALWAGAFGLLRVAGRCQAAMRRRKFRRRAFTDPEVVRR